MRALNRFLLSSVLVLTFFSAWTLLPAWTWAEAAQFIFHNGAVYTVNEQQPWASAVAVKDNRIVYVGDDSGALEFKGPSTKMIDASGKMILPGFIDSHAHPIWGGRVFMGVNLQNAKTVKDVQDALLAFREQNPEATFINGSGWVLENFAEGRPRKEWIDAAVDDIPVLLIDHFGHSAFANSKAFQLAGISAATPDPQGGYFERSPTSGELTGLIREDAAIDKLAYVFSNFSAAMDYKSLKLALDYLNSNGVTSFITAYMIGEPLGQTFVDLYKNNELTARTTLCFRVTADMPVDKMLAAMKRRRMEIEKVDKDFMRADMAKLFLDGVILSHTAVMVEPYAGEFAKHNYQPYLFTDKQLQEYALALNAADFGLYFHAVGDGAARQGLDVVEHVIKQQGRLTKVPSISHLTVVTPEDLSRFNTLGVRANVQLFFGKHTEIVDKVEAYLGPQRSRNIYAFNSLAKAGATLVASSDWPVITADPFAAMEIAATRPRTSIQATGDELYGGDPWLPGEKLDVATMIRAYTIEGAKLQKLENNIGSLEVGKFADLIMIDQNLLDIPLPMLHKTKVLLTMVNGDIVFSK